MAASKHRLNKSKEGKGAKNKEKWQNGWEWKEKVSQNTNKAILRHPEVGGGHGGLQTEAQLE